MRPLELARRLPKFVAFASVGAAGFVLNEGVLFSCVDLGKIPVLDAAVLAFAASITFNWWSNRTLTFHRSRARGGVAQLREWARYVGFNSFGLGANYGSFAALTQCAPNPFASPYVALAFGTLAGLVVNFHASKRGVFRG